MGRGLNDRHDGAIMSEQTTIQEIAGVLRSTDKMADQFAQRVQERVGQPVPYDDILAVMQKMPARTLTLEKVVTRLRRQQQ